MELQRMGHAYKVIDLGNGRYQAVMILSEHDNYDEAFRASIEAMNQEFEELDRLEREELKAQGIDVVTLEEAIQGMTAEELERFTEVRNRVFVTPLMNGNIRMIENKRKSIKRKSIMRSRKI